MSQCRRTKSVKYRRGDRRRGVQTLEVIVVLPIVIITTFAVFQFGIAMVVEQAVTHAATVGAREAGKGADIDELVVVVEEVLFPHGITIGTDASVVLEDPMAPSPVEQRGTVTCDPPLAPTLGVDEVRVTVCVDLGASPFLNALTSYGINFAGKQFTVSSAVRKQIN